MVNLMLKENAERTGDPKEPLVFTLCTDLQSSRPSNSECVLEENICLAHSVRSRAVMEDIRENPTYFSDGLLNLLFQKILLHQTSHSYILLSGICK